MNHFSFLKAGLACCPGVGPLVSLHNFFEFDAKLKTEISSDFSQSCPAAFKNALTYNEGISSQVFGTRLATNIGWSNRLRNLPTLGIQNKSSIIETGNVYSLCGLLGNVLTVAIVVSWLASQVLTGSVGGPILFVCALEILVFCRILYDTLGIRQVLE